MLLTLYNENMNNDNIDFLIQGMTSIELENIMKKWKNDKSNIMYWEFANRNHISYITTFFSEPLQNNGKYINGTKLSDLLILYYLDYRLKIILSKHVLDTERHLDIAMMNSGVHAGDKENTFSAKERLFNKQSDKKKLEIVELYDDANYVLNKTIKTFSKNIYAAVKLRNFCLHHYPILSYKYACKISNGDRHIEKDGEERVLIDDINSLNKLMSPKYITSQKNRIRKHLVGKYSFSTDEIKENIFAFYNNVFGFDIVKYIPVSIGRTGLVSAMLSAKKRK